MTINTNSKKVTKKEIFAKLFDIVADATIAQTVEQVGGLQVDEFKKFLTHEIELLDKKSTAKSTKPTKTQLENEKLKELILTVLENKGTPQTISQIMAESGELSTLTNQRVSALLTQLKNAGRVVRTEEKKKAYFAIA